MIVLTMIITLLQNAYVCYMKLYHFKEARKCAKYMISLKQDFVKGYVLLGQATLFNKQATYFHID